MLKELQICTNVPKLENETAYFFVAVFNGATFFERSKRLQSNTTKFQLELKVITARIDWTFFRYTIEFLFIPTASQL